MFPNVTIPPVTFVLSSMPGPVSKAPNKHSKLSSHSAVLAFCLFITEAASGGVCSINLKIVIGKVLLPVLYFVFPTFRGDVDTPFD